MKKYLTSFVFLVLFAGYAALQYLNNSSAAYSAPVAITTSAPTPQSTTTVASSQSVPSPTMNGSGSSSGATEVTQQPTQTTTAQAPAQPTPAPAPVSTPQGQYIDGTYTGSPENAFYGMVQVQVTVSGGKIANVQFLSYPNDRSTSLFINQQATPILAQEAIQAQSANVNGVSGASDTSAAFVQSLSSALVQAKA